MTGRRALAACALAVAAVATDAFLIEPNVLVPRRLTLASPGVRDPVRALLVSDIGFTREGRRERALRRVAEEFDPHVVLVAGDLVERRSDVDLATLEAAREFLVSLPAAHGRFFVPGEAEERALDLVTRSWRASGIEILANRSRTLRVGNSTLDIHGVDRAGDPGPWGAGRDAAGPYVYSEGRRLSGRLAYRGEGAEAWEDRELTLAFRAGDPDSQLDIRFVWREGPPPERESGWRLLRHRHAPSFVLVGSFPEPPRLTGRLDSGFVPPPGVWCRARIRATDDGRATRIRARFWRAGEPEPDAWTVDASHAGPERCFRGTVALGARLGSPRYADLRVVGPEGEVLLEETFEDAGRLAGPWQYHSRLAQWLLERDDDAARLLLAHDPDVVLDVAAVGAPPPTLVLAGHTHGGQIRLPLVGALYASTTLGRRYAAGLLDYRGIRLYVTRGVGTSIVPARFFNPPEATLLTLLPEGGGAEG